MNKRLVAMVLAFPLALALGTGAAQAQLKAPTKSQSKDGLGSGLGAPSPQGGPAPAETAAPAAPSAPPAPEKAQKVQTSDEIVQEIANCVLGGLPPDWVLAQIEVREIGRSDKQREFEAFYSYKDAAGKAAAFTPCDKREPAMNVYKLNAALEPAKRNWMRVTLVLSKEGKFELQYDYTKDADPKAAAPAAKAAAAPDAKKTAKKKPPAQ